MSPCKRRHHGGKRAPAGKWERWQFLATTARFVVEVLQLLRDHVISGGGPGRLT